MHRALQALLFAPDVALWSDIILKRRTATIREGHRDYRQGPVMLCCHIASACVMAEVGEVLHCRLDEVSDLKLRQAGYESCEELLAGMRRFYPKIQPGAGVTVIAFSDLKGTLVDTGMVVMAPTNRGDNPLITRLNGR
ncbi:MAG: ASCH domain-containing protein [Patescibacteria group bacterium]